MFEILWVAVMVVIVAMAITSFIKGSKSADRQMDVNDMLTAKRVKADLRSGSSASGAALIKKGTGGDPAKAEEPDR